MQNKKGTCSMDSKVFIELAKKIIRDYTNEHLDKSDNISITEEDVFVVWYNKSLQNHKALLSTKLYDGMYYELTYNGDKEELYIDAYKKFQNICLSKEKMEEVK